MGKTFSTGLLTNGIWQDASNNIGIGGSPSGSYKLEVTGTAKVSGITSLTSATASTSTTTGGLVVTGGVGIGGTIFGTTATFSGQFSIGTTAPAWSAFTNMLNLQSGSIGGTSTTDFRIFQNMYYDGGSYRTRNIGESQRWDMGSGALYIYTAASAAANAVVTPTLKFNITNTGAATFSSDVTIGPNNGSFKGFGFSVTVSSVSQGGLFPYSGVTGSGTDYSPTLFADSSNNLYFCAGGSTNKKMTVNSNGIITILNLAAAGSRTVTADSSGNLSATSDSSLKQEDTTYTIEGLAEVLQLKPRAYKWLNDIEIRGEEAATEIGFFADEVNPIIPSAAPKGNDGLYGFYDRAVIAAMVKAIQELSAQNQDLKSRLDKAGL